MVRVKIKFRGLVEMGSGLGSGSQLGWLGLGLGSVEIAGVSLRG